MIDLYAYEQYFAGKLQDGSLSDEEIRQAIQNSKFKIQNSKLRVNN